MLVSRPLSEKRQMSGVAVLLDGRYSFTGFPPNVHELFATEKIPRAATFKSTSFPGTDTPAVVGSTTTMSLPVAVGATFVKRNHIIGRIWCSDHQRNRIRFRAIWILNLDTHTPGCRHIYRSHRRCAFRRRTASRYTRRPAKEQNGARARCRDHEAASVDSQCETIGATGIYTCGMQRGNVRAGRDDHVCSAHLCRVIGADRHNLQGAW
jgi:hypothetical protein